jgi:protein O-mannosyl-transferase
LAWMLYELEYSAWGLDPRGYHLASLILHAAVGVALYTLIRALVGRAMPAVEASRSRPAIPTISGLAAAAFAVHPLRVEVVAWASCQPYLPCAGLTLLSVLAYLRSVDGGPARPGWRFASVALYLAAMGFKAVPIGLPFVLLILDRSVLGRSGPGYPLRAIVLEKVPHLIVAIVASGMAMHAGRLPDTPEDPSHRPSTTPAERAAEAAYGLVYYLEATAWPVDLSAYHFRPNRIEPAAPPFAGRLAAAAALGAVAYGLRRRCPAITAALLSYAILQAPSLGLVPHGPMLVADRYAYIPTVPLFVVAAGGLVRLVAGARRPAIAASAIVAIGVVLVALLATMSASLCRSWRDSEALWARALAIGSGRDALLESHLGIELYRVGRVEEGLAHIERAVAIDAADPFAQYNLGVAMLKQGDAGRAIAHLTETVRLAPDEPEYRHRLGVALARFGRFDEAQGQLHEAVRLQPKAVDVHVTLGNVLVDLGRGDEASAEFTRALQLVPGHRGARAGLERLKSRSLPSP